MQLRILEDRGQTPVLILRYQVFGFLYCLHISCEVFHCVDCRDYCGYSVISCQLHYPQHNYSLAAAVPNDKA